jgi:hypothetical protein
VRSPVPKDKRDGEDEHNQQNVDETKVLAGFFGEVFESANRGVSAVVIDGHRLTEYDLGFRSIYADVLLITN